MKHIAPRTKMRRNLVNELLVECDKKTVYKHREGGSPYVSIVRIGDMVKRFRNSY